MDLKDLITIDKESRTPNYEQVTTQIIELAENGLLTSEMCIMPEYSVFAKEIGVTRLAANKIYNRLVQRGYAEYVNNGNSLAINCKARAVRQLQESIKFAIRQGITFEEIIVLLANSK